MIRIRPWLTVVVVVVVAFAVSSCSGHVKRAAAPASSTATVASMPSRSGWLAGAWIAHTFSLRIDRAGRGTLLWRTYRRCGHDAPPCDSFRGDAVVDGGRATATFTTHGRVVASGRVLTSTDPIHFPIGSLRVRFDRKNDLLYMRPTPRTPLCGPAAAAVHCG